MYFLGFCLIFLKFFSGQGVLHPKHPRLYVAVVSALDVQLSVVGFNPELIHTSEEIFKIHSISTTTAVSHECWVFAGGDSVSQHSQSARSRRESFAAARATFTDPQVSGIART